MEKLYQSKDWTHRNEDILKVILTAWKTSQEKKKGTKCLNTHTLNLEFLLKFSDKDQRFFQKEV